MGLTWLSLFCTVKNLFPEKCNCSKKYMMRGAWRNYIFIDTKPSFFKSTNRASHPIFPFYCILIIRCFQDLHHRCSVWTTEGKARGRAKNGLLPSLAGREEQGRGLICTVIEAAKGIPFELLLRVTYCQPKLRINIYIYIYIYIYSNSAEPPQIMPGSGDPSQYTIVLMPSLSIKQQKNCSKSFFLF